MRSPTRNWHGLRSPISTLVRGEALAGDVGGIGGIGGATGGFGQADCRKTNRGSAR